VLTGWISPTTPLTGFDPVLISLIRKSMPNLLAYDICGVQPMTGPTGMVFSMKTKAQVEEEETIATPPMPPLEYVAKTYKKIYP